VIATLAFVASVVFFLWAIFAGVFANGIFAGGDSHPPEAPDLLTPVLLGATSTAGGVLALVKRGGR
jgi:hypothetical protein